MKSIKRALISVSDKKGVLEFAKELHNSGVEILSTGGTAELLRKGGVPVIQVSDYTGFPEMMGGRIKTLHPRVHGGILARRDVPDHMKVMEEHGIRPIDLVVINLYPFEQTVAKEGCTLEEAIENIDTVIADFVMPEELIQEDYFEYIPIEIEYSFNDVFEEEIEIEDNFDINPMEEFFFEDD